MRRSTATASAASRGHPRSRAARRQAARPAFPPRHQPAPAHCQPSWGPRRAHRAGGRPGPGRADASALLQRKAARVIAIERDPRCIEALGELVGAAEGRLLVVEADALAVDLASIADGQTMTIVANLPYNVGTALLIRWLDQLAIIDGMTLMFQREVADRLTATPGGKDYGRLSVLVQWLCRSERLINLPAKAFVPRPQGRLLDRRSHAARPASLPCGQADSRTRPGGGLRPTPKDAAHQPEIPDRRSQEDAECSFA